MLTSSDVLTIAKKVIEVEAQISLVSKEIDAAPETEQLKIVSAELQKLQKSLDEMPAAIKLKSLKQELVTLQEQLEASLTPATFTEKPLHQPKLDGSLGTHRLPHEMGKIAIKIPQGREGEIFKFLQKNSGAFHVNDIHRAIRGKLVCSQKGVEVSCYNVVRRTKMIQKVAPRTFEFIR